MTDIQAIHTRKKLIQLEQSTLLSNYGDPSNTQSFFNMAESNNDDCIRFIALESEHLELNQELLRIGLTLRDIEDMELRKGIKPCNN